MSDASRGSTLEIILLESALELVPQEIISHPQVIRSARRYLLSPGQMLLDAGIHWKAMKLIDRWWRRGRPDIVHVSLLNLLEKYPVRSGKVSVYMHVQDGRVFRFSPEVRIPKNYDRFKGLMSQLLRLNSVPPGSGSPLIYLVARSLREFLSGGNRKLMLLTEDGDVDMTPHDVVVKAYRESYVVGFGAYPRGPFSDEVLSLASIKVRRRGGEPLRAWDVACALSNAYYDLP